ncbi:uncharacterized protein LOC110114348 [Dendrobium catenatum]|uniref:uncharacterized protein LOC110114348 n=1 Tax=Dendrobium catenatum TaxID=906689 RepID=UPI0009F240EE|nr:uncharacterized protein LOC110114348 [Dendrobium catenatum]
MTDGQSASQAAPVNSTAPVVGSDTVSQFSMLVAQMMSETQNRASTVRSKDVDRHLQIFLKLKPPRFEGTVETRAVEDWLRMLEKIFDGMQCPSDMKVPLAIFLLDGEAERWWTGQQEEKFQGKLNFLITWEEFFEVFRSRKRFSGDTSGSGFFKKKRFVSRDPKRSGQFVSTIVSGSGSVTSSGSVSGAPVCQTYGRRHYGQCYRMTGQCFRCGHPGHQITECLQAGSDRRSESRYDSFARSVGRSTTVPPHTISEGFFGRAGGSDFMARRPPSGSQRESGSSAAPAPIQPRVYSLNQQKARDTPDVVTCTIFISEHLCRVLFDSGASHSFIFELYFDALRLDSVTLLI